MTRVFYNELYFYLPRVSHFSYREKFEYSICSIPKIIKPTSRELIASVSLGMATERCLGAAIKRLSLETGRRDLYENRRVRFPITWQRGHWRKPG